MFINLSTLDEATFKDLEIKCHEPSKTIINQMVFVTGQNGLTYKNKYCALCNGVTTYSVWSISAFISPSSTGKCSIDLVGTESFLNHSLRALASHFLNNCDFISLPSLDLSPRFCFRYHHKTGNCGKHLYQNVVYKGKKLYKNIDCCLVDKTCPSCSSGPYNCGVNGNDFLTHGDFSEYVLDFENTPISSNMTATFDLNRNEVICNPMVRNISFFQYLLINTFAFAFGRHHFHGFCEQVFQQILGIIMG